MALDDEALVRQTQRGDREVPSRLFGDPALPEYLRLWRVAFEVTNLDFGIQHDQVRGDARPLAMAVMHLHVEISSLAWPDRDRTIHLDKALTVKIASPVSGGRKTLDGLCQAAAQAIANLVRSLAPAE